VNHLFNYLFQYIVHFLSKILLKTCIWVISSIILNFKKLAIEVLPFGFANFKMYSLENNNFKMYNLKK